MLFQISINIIVFIILIMLLAYLQKRHVAFTKRVFMSLGLGIILGIAFQWIYGTHSPVIAQTMGVVDIVGTGYVKLLQMIVVPLVMISIISAILKLQGHTSVGKISILTLGTLLITTLIAAIVGISVTHFFHLSATQLLSNGAGNEALPPMTEQIQSVKSLSFSQLIISFIPANPFLDMTGARKTSTIAVVIFSVIIALAATSIAKKKPELFATFSRFVEVAQAIIMRMVTLVLRLTPYGILALMTKIIAGSSWEDVFTLIRFIVASYVAIIIMFCVHLALLSVAGISPLRWFKKAIPVLIFAFTSRSSAGAIPVNVATQNKLMGIPAGIANFAASFGTSIGQNGCAGIYPAMLAVMVAPTVGISPLDAHFLITLLAVVVIGSFGVAGVGGGGTFAALIVLSAMNLPVTLVGILISIEPLIDMGRTALNVDGAMLAGTLTSRFLGQMDMDTFNSHQEINLDEELS